MAKSKFNWYPSDRPYDSEFCDLPSGMVSARVMPSPRLGFEWSIWHGPEGRRYLFDDGVSSSRSGAKRAAERRLKRY